ncbi:MAG: hypothetical protein GY870_22720, partial [archaeon]|nr:hypothetical protein [archaeon]
MAGESDLFDILIGNIFDFINQPLFLMSVGFWIFCFVLIKILGKNKDNVVLAFPFLAMFRTRKVNEWFHKVAKKSPKLWRLIWNVGIIVSFCFTIFGLWFFFSNLGALILNPRRENAISPLIPGVTVSFLEFSYLILPILFCMTVHEFSHAIASEIDDIKVKSTGVLGAGVFFIIAYGAFVELDEFAVYSRKVSPWTRLRIAGAGTFSNAIQAGIGLLILVNFAFIISPMYGPNVFRVESVLTAPNGGYNEGNLFAGDVVLRISDENGYADLNYQNGTTLTSVLQNETDVKCTPGDLLNFMVIDENGTEQIRNITLGYHFFVGFQYEFLSNSEEIMQITDVYDRFQGGNNYNKGLEVGMNFTAIDGNSFNKTDNINLDTYLKTLTGETEVNLTLTNGSNITINIDYYPDTRYLGVYEFRSFYTGAFFTKETDTEVNVDRVLSNLTENGINDGNLNKNDTITHVNGIKLDLSGEKSFEDFLINDVGLLITESTPVILTVIDIFGTIINRTIYFEPIPKSYVYIGVMTSSYWVPNNPISSLLGSDFAIWLQTEIMFFYMIAFSFTLFNMLPLPIVDGGRIVKELVNWIVGSEYKRGQEKKLKILFDPKESDYHLMTIGISE